MYNTGLVSSASEDRLALNCLAVVRLAITVGVNPELVGQANSILGRAGHGATSGSRRSCRIEGNYHPTGCLSCPKRKGEN